MVHSCTHAVRSSRVFGGAVQIQPPIFPRAPTASCDGITHDSRRRDGRCELVHRAGSVYKLTTRERFGLAGRTL